MIEFNKAMAKGEGMPVEGYGPVAEPKVATTWLEMCIPEKIEDECYRAVVAVLRYHGYAEGWNKK